MAAWMAQELAMVVQADELQIRSKGTLRGTLTVKRLGPIRRTEVLRNG
jgi:hypothetical protein